MNLVLKLDAFCEECGFRRVDMLFDEVDEGVECWYRKSIDETREIAQSTSVRKGWDPDSKTVVRGEIRMKVVDPPFRLDTQFFGELCIAGKRHPLVLAADIVANSLLRHLEKLPFTAHLNAPESIRNWELKEQVWGATEGAIGDLI